MHTVRDYGTSEAQTTYGKIGVKVWVFKGEIITESRTIERGVAADVNA